MRWFSVRPTLSLKGRKFKGLRGFSGKPFHPPLTDIPIGAYIIAAVFDLLSVWKGDGEMGHNFHVAASYTLIAGAVASIPTVLTGIIDWWTSTQRGTQAWRTANTHGAIMGFNSILVAINVFARIGDIDTTASTSTGLMILSLAIAGIVSLGATYGGTLVYDYEFNVEQDKGYAWEKTERDYMPNEKPDSTGEHA